MQLKSCSFQFPLSEATGNVIAFTTTTIQKVLLAYCGGFISGWNKTVIDWKSNYFDGDFINKQSHLSSINVIPSLFPLSECENLLLFLCSGCLWTEYLVLLIFRTKQSIYLNLLHPKTLSVPCSCWIFFTCIHLEVQSPFTSVLGLSFRVY